LRFSHIRELVTIIEMLASSSGVQPLSKTQSSALRGALKAALDNFAAKEANGGAWRATIERRIDYINTYDAKIMLQKFISGLPVNIVSVPEGFHSKVIDLRNDLAHDISRIKSSDQNKLAFFVAKLKAIYALNDAIALGARIDEIGTGASFFLEADYVPLNSFGDDVD
jgi:hypothetical protein